MPEASHRGRIRIADPISDTKGILAIYAPVVRNTSISLELEAPTLEEMATRISTGLEKHPWLVCEEDGEILGYAYACGHRPRGGYQWTAESGVHVAPTSYRQGVGTSLQAVMFDILLRQGYYKVLGGITLPNDPSVQLHLRNGFDQVGIYRNVGFKFGKWWDTAWFQKDLRPHLEVELEPVIPFSQLNYKFDYGDSNDSVAAPPY